MRAIESIDIDAQLRRLLLAHHTAVCTFDVEDVDVLAVLVVDLCVEDFEVAHIKVVTDLMQQLLVVLACAFDDKHALPLVIVQLRYRVHQRHF